MERLKKLKLGIEIRRGALALEFLDLDSGFVSLGGMFNPHSASTFSSVK